MEILDGKFTSQSIKDEIKVEVANMVKAGKRAPHLAAVLVGENGASKTYVNGKISSCEYVGFKSSLIKLDVDTTEEELLKVVAGLNNDPELDGFIVQLPLPKHIDESKVTLAINPEKDVDGFHPVNIGKMVLGEDCYLPATPAGIVELLKRYKVETEGKDCVVLGRSLIVGTPMSILLSRNEYPGNCTVTLAHSRTKNLKELTQKADIIVVALGKPEFLTGDMIKEGVTIVDVGITRVEDASKKRGYAIKGDVNFDSCKEKAGFITPVPGGVGPMTIASLLINTLKSANKA